MEIRSGARRKREDAEQVVKAWPAHAMARGCFRKKG
jgi:hypothetical protein